jgi:2',3'-cyclic-nucleotide 2'-phosphodiesterase
MKILFVGDVFGDVGRRVLAERLSSLQEQEGIDLTVANGENTAGGIGITKNIFKKLRKYGVQVVTGGNHSFSYPDSDADMMEYPELLRPHNAPPGNAGKGVTVVQAPGGQKVAVVNLMGRTYFSEVMDCPFRTGAAAVAELRSVTPIILVDFHAEATSEKIALAYHLDGAVSAVVGTHTHVQTADERILAGGTAFITDAGMTGPEDSVIGMDRNKVVKRFLLQTRYKLEPAHTGPMLNAVVIDIDDVTGRATGIKRIFERITFHDNG